MGLEIRPITSEELGEYVSALELAVGRRPGARALADARASLELERTLAAFDGGRIVAGIGSDALELTVPGCATVPTARITLTGVLPTHRRRGLSSALNVEQLRRLRAHGEPFAVFTTTGPGFYRRFGYSPATRAMEVEIETARGSLDVGAADGAVRVLDDAERDRFLPEIYDRHRRLQPGQVSRPPAFWPLWFLDREGHRKGEPGDRFAAVFEDAGGTAQGYLTYRLRPGDPRAQPVETLVVEDLVAVTGDARRGLWDFCLAFEQAVRVIAHNLPVDEPLAWMLADPGRLRVTRVRDFTWLRLVALETALAARTYAASGDLVLDVADPVCPENAGRFLLESDGAAGAVTPTGRAADLALDVADLAAAYLGGTTFSTLARAGRVRELNPGALARADALFASQPAPWTVSDW